MDRERDRRLARVDQGRELARSARAADEVDPLVRTDVENTEHRCQQLILQQADVERGDGIRLARPDPRPERAPAASEIHRYLTARRRVFGRIYLEAPADHRQERVWTQAAESLDDPVVRKDLH